MGRGRAKAKQTKVARELKYSSQGTDFEALQRELASSGQSNGSARTTAVDDEVEDLPSDYDDWATDRS